VLKDDICTVAALMQVATVAVMIAEMVALYITIAKHFYTVNLCYFSLYHFFVFTARCYAECDYATVCCLSVCPSVCPSVCDVAVPWTHRL